MEIMFIVFFATLSFSFGLSYWATSSKLKKSNLMLADLFIKNRALEELNNQANNGINMSDDTLHKENFIKFLSDSRDWAFTYIEDLQKSLTQFVKEVDPNINYFIEFSSLQEDNSLGDNMKKISVAYLDLKKFLPNESEIKNT
jgi:hypothetical protein